jgi:hypothetical protein
MAQDPKKKKPQPVDNKGVSKFTFNVEGSQELSVPSITTLLQRKRRTVQLATRSTHTAEQGASAHAPAAKASPKAASAKPQGAPVAVVKPEPILPPTPAKRRNGARLSLANWSASDPMPSVARGMIDKGITSLLFLSSKGGAPSGATYGSVAGYQLGARREALCAGIQLSSAIAPDLWERVFKSMFVELNTQPSTESVHFLRQVLGAEDNEWVLISKYAQGPEQGLMIVYSKNSLASELTAQLTGAPAAPAPSNPSGLAELPKKKRTGKTGLFKRAA